MTRESVAKVNLAMNEIPVSVSLIFGLTTLLTVFTFYKAAGSSEATLYVMAAWISLQTCISLSGFYAEAPAMQFRLLLVVMPPITLVAGLFLTKRGKAYLNRLDVHLLSIIHIVRIPVDLVIYWLFIARMLPYEATCGGGSLDIFAGFSAPVVYYFGMLKHWINWFGLFCWNILSMGLLVNLGVKSVLFAPCVFGEPGAGPTAGAVSYFPFVFLPSMMIPIILISHLAVIRKLIKVRGFDWKSQIGWPDLR